MAKGIKTSDIAADKNRNKGEPIGGTTWYASSPSGGYRTGIARTLALPDASPSLGLNPIMAQGPGAPGLGTMNNA